MFCQFETLSDLEAFWDINHLQVTMFEQGAHTKEQKCGIK